MISANMRMSTDLEKNLKSIGLEIRQKVMTGAVRAASVSLKKEVQKNAPNFLEKTIIVKKRRTKSKNYTHYALTYKSDDNGWLNVVYEYGSLGNRETALSPKTKRKKSWKVKSWSAKRRSTDGGIKATAHFRRAFEEEGADTFDVAKKYINKRIKKIKGVT